MLQEPLPNLKINLPSIELVYQRKNNVLHVFDRVRKKYVPLTPEEYIRQHVIGYLIDYLRIGPGLIAIEKEIRIQQSISRRPDIVVYDSKDNALMLVECKSPNIAVNQSAFAQIGVYNRVLDVQTIWITNGFQHCIYHYKTHAWLTLTDLIQFFK